MANINTTYYTELFSVTDSNGTLVTGLSNANFTKYVYKNGIVNSVVATVSEINSGRYQASFTPNAVGDWSVLVTHATYNANGWVENVEVEVVDDEGFGAITVTQSNFGGTGAVANGSGSPLDGVSVTAYISTDTSFTNPLAQAATDVNGNWTMFLDAGTYVLTFKKTGFTFSNETRVVTA